MTKLVSMLGVQIIIEELEGDNAVPPNSSYDVQLGTAPEQEDPAFPSPVKIKKKKKKIKKIVRNFGKK